MRVAFSIRDACLDGELGAPFARCAAFAVVDTETGERQLVQNPAANLEKNAGTAAARYILQQNVDAVVSGLFGARASSIFEEAEVPMYKATSGTIDDFLGEAGVRRS